MSKVYIILSIIVLGLAGGLLILPEIDRSKDVDPKILMEKIKNQSRFLSVDFVAERLINEDPSIMLIDVRSPDQFESYSLPGAINIPMDEILLPEWEDYFNQEDMDVVLFSNGDLYADQVWIICARLGYNNIFVMSGGLNQWFKNIMQPDSPLETDPSEAFELYAFRKAACQHFGGSSQEILTSEKKPEQVQIIKRKKKVVTEGGC